MMTPIASGETADGAYPEWRISSQGYTAVITAVGASLRELQFRGRDLVVPFDFGAVRPLYRGAVIAPWPNRIADGRYDFDGAQYQLAINEVDRGHALHGLVHWVRWEPLDVTPNRITLGHILVPQDGYPFALKLAMEYRVGSTGLACRLTATNIGTGPAPYGCCPHPYLIAGAGLVDNWILDLPAERRLEVDDRLLPTGLRPVTDVDCDFRTPARIGDREIDHAFTDLISNDGRVEVRLTDLGSGTGVALSWDQSWAPWVQIHTADRPEPQHNRVGLAVEPMNCRPDAFNSGVDTPVLAADRTHVAAWLISAIADRAGR